MRTLYLILASLSDPDWYIVALAAFATVIYLVLAILIAVAIVAGLCTLMEKRRVRKLREERAASRFATGTRLATRFKGQV